MLIASAIVSGLGLGSMYGLLALGFHVTHAVSRTVNFAQGSTMMLGAVLCFTFWVTLGWPLALAVVLALAACALWGVVVERVAVRPFVARGSNSWLIATVALGIVLENVVLFTFGKDPRGMPPGVLTTGSITIAGVRIQYLQALIPVIGLALAAGLQAFFATSRHGKALLAVVQNRDAARLMGIRVERVVEVGVCAVGIARRHRRHSGRAAVHHFLHHGHAVRHQGFRRRHPRRHRKRLGRGAGRASSTASPRR